MSTRGFGGLRAVGASGYSWSSSIAGTNARNLGFGYSWLNPQSSYGRAYGFPLRCLQEEGFLCPAGRHPACFRGHSVKPSSPNPLGENQSFSLNRSSRGGSYFL